MIRMYYALSKFYFPLLKNRLKKLMRFCDIEKDEDRSVGKSVLGALLFTIVFTTFLSVLVRPAINTLIILVVVLFFVGQMVAYAWFLLRADAKARFVDDILPDVLLLMAMNIKSGMTTDRALIMAARPEFGPLEKALGRAGRQILAGKEIKYALLDISSKIKSTLLDRTIRLVIEGIESGGEISSLLEQTAEDIQSTKLVQNEVRGNLLMYAIFIFFAVGFGAPMLFGISTYLVSSIGTQFSAFDISSGGGQTAKAIQVSPEFLVMFAMIALAITSFFGSLIIGVVKGGSEKSGLKLVPILITMSYIVFFSVRLGVSSIFPAIG